MEPHTFAPPPGRAGAGLMVATLLLAGAFAGLAVGASPEALAAAVKKPKPTVTASPTGSPSPTTSPTASPTTSPTATPTSSPSPTATATSSPTPTLTPTPTSPPSTTCAVDMMVPFEGNLYCPGEIAGVEASAYGLDTRVVLSVTVTDVTGDLVTIMGGPDCWVDPASTEPVYCGAIVGTMVVDFSGAAELPAPSTAIDLYGVTQAFGGFHPDGFITVAWCDPDYCP
jgi:cytoskeletal protein RodZ